jgi:hypothetical protein
MAVTVVNQWANSVSPAYNQSPSPPAGLSLPVTVENTPGDWMFAICAWRPAVTGSGVTVSVDDDARNWWEPLGAPLGDSSPLGATRTSIWVAPAARVGNSVTGATTVMVAPTGPVVGLAAIVLDVAGLGQWLDQQAGIWPLYANQATSLPLSFPAPPSQVFLLTAAATDLGSATISFTGTAFTALTGVSSSNGLDTSGDLALNAEWKLTTSTSTPTWSSSATCDFAGTIAGIVIAAPPPLGPGQNWPIVITEVSPGSGVKTPPSEVGWTTVSHRSLGFSFTQGQPYLLGGLQAGQGALTLDNPDLNLTPPGQGPWAGIDSGCPVRVRAILPGILPANATPHYVAFSGFIQQLPTSFDEGLRGVMQATLADVFAYATASIPPVLEAEILTDSPYAYWPLTDPQGAQAASNAAPGNPNPLILTPAKFGTAGVTAQFGQNSGALKGDSGDGMFSQAGVPSSGLDGYSLACFDSGYPRLHDGVTIEGWFAFTSGTPSSGDPITLQNSINSVLETKVTGGNLEIIGFSGPGASTTVTLSTLNFTTAPLWHLAVTTTRTAYTIYINGQQVASGTWGRTLFPAFSAVWVNGNWSPFGNSFGKLYNGYSAHCAVFAGLLPPARIQAHYQAGVAAFEGEYAHYRIERLLGYAGLPARRLVIPEAPGMPGGFSVISATPPQDTTPMSSMATIGGVSAGLQAPGQPGFTPGSGTQANQALVDTALSTAPALLTVSPAGGMAYVPRGYSSNQPVKWTLGDDPAAGEIPFLGDVVFGYDPGYVKNDVQLSQPDTGTTTSPSIAATVAASQDQYGDQSYTATGYLQYDATAGNIQPPTMADLANWIAATSATPRLRAGPVTVRASALNPVVVPAAWAFVLGAASGDVVVVNTRPPTSPGAVISVTARIMQLTRNLNFSPDAVDGSVQVTLDACPEEDVLACDDPSRGVLSGTNCLGW